ncbi:MAG: exopolysaccharide biosynthesis protein [Hyphomonadaceae bacterium]|nr:exopolysaccharide biosynthesis protein [Hyphomonadaceae bacterium]
MSAAIDAPSTDGPKVENLSALLDRIAASADDPEDAADGRISIREILGHVGRRSYGPLLLFIGLFSISPATIVPGMTWLSAGMTLVIAGQMAVGRKHVWLPRKALDAAFEPGKVKGGVEKLRPWARRIDSFLKPRLRALAAPPLVILVALLCILAALITFPLGFIPFAPLAPGIAIVLFGLGMTAHDGLLLLLGAAPAIAAFALALPLLT